MSSYRPQYNNVRDLPPPPPPLDMPPLPPRPPPSWPPDRTSETWRTRDYRAQVPQGEFSFRNSESAPKYPRHQDGYRPSVSAESHGDGYRQRENRPRDARARSPPRNARGRNQRGPRGRFNRVLPSDRPLLQQRDRQGATEQTLGVDSSAQKFLSIDDITDSEEEIMDVSDSDGGENEADKDERADEEPPAKRRTISAAQDESGREVPKWSNPDPYSVLPPVDETGRKRKDPVKLIRKAFKHLEQPDATQDQVQTNDDFISFDNEDSDDDDDEDDDYDKNQKSKAISDSWTSPSKVNFKLDVGDMVNGSSHFQEDDLHAPVSRKRTYADEIKSEKQRKGGFMSAKLGSLKQQWIPPNPNEATPWLTQGTAEVSHPGFRLHREICDFYEFVRPVHFEQAVRDDLLARLRKLAAREYPGCYVHCFGSFAAGLYLPNADMDLVMNSKTFEATQEKVICRSGRAMFKFGEFLRRTGMAHPSSVEVINKAKVPIVKFVDRTTGIKVDISFENSTGVVANSTFATWKRQYPAMPILVMIIKQFLLMRGLNEVHTGGLGGFSVICLVVSLLQNMPRIQAGSFPPEQHLGEILVEFLDFYGNRLDITRTGISMDPPGYFDKHAMNRVNLRGPGAKVSKANRLAIIDPNRPENDISGGSANAMLIFERFSCAHSEILAAMKASNRPSLLDWLVGGNYEIFASHRAHLQSLYRDPGVVNG